MLFSFCVYWQLFYHWHLKFIYGVKAFVYLIIYYFIGNYYLIIESSFFTSLLLISFIKMCSFEILITDHGNWKMTFFVKLLGSSLPSAYLLWIIREMPPPGIDSIQEEPGGTYTFISHADEASGSIHPWSWTADTSSKNQVHFIIHIALFNILI